MKNKNWKILLATSESRLRLKQVTVTSSFVLVMVVLCLAGLVGFGRLVYFSSSLGLAKLGVYEQQLENNKLLNKVSSLEKEIKQEAGRLETIAEYEDLARIKYGLDHISKDVRLAGIGGKPSRDELISSYLLDNVAYRSVELRYELADLLRRSELLESTFSQMSEIVGEKHYRWSQRPAIWPAFGRLTSGYGYRQHPFTGRRIFHRGIDIANQTWTPVFATANGKVHFAGSRHQFGRTVILDHNDGEYRTLYAHLHKYTVSAGQVVRRGELIGYIGTTGMSTGPHLHYEVHKNGRTVNPLAFILSSDVLMD
ncbi:Peptidase, M23/M37 family [Chitinispirillum alkaliphilum]|nr:Peptidase, M23/M37 family [Chitinispirillum alkaliphilum]